MHQGYGDFLPWQVKLPEWTTKMTDKPLKYLWMQPGNRFGQTTRLIKEMIGAIQETGALKAEIKVTSPDVQSLESFIRDLARQKTCAEIEKDEDYDGLDCVDDAYDIIIDRARRLLSQHVVQEGEK